MTIIPRLDLIEKDGTIYLEVLIKTLPVGNIISSTSDIISITVLADNSQITLFSSKDPTYWYNTRPWVELSTVKNYKISINTGYTDIVYNAGVIHWKYK